MARGGMPARPAGGGGRGGTPPPRRGAQPRKPPPTQPRKPSTNQPRTQNNAAGRKTAPDLRQLRQAEQQRKAGEQQHKLRQAQHLREAHLVRGRADAERRSAELRDQVARLESILSTGLQRSPRIDLDSLQRTPAEPPFDPGPLATPPPEPAWEKFAPGRLASLGGGRARREQQEADAKAAYEQAREQWERDEEQRQEQLAEAERAHAELLAANRKDADAYNSRIARVASGLRFRDPKVVESFLRTVLRRVPFPPGFPRRFEVTHYPYAEQVTLRVVLPGRQVIPAISGYEYAAPANEVRAVPRPDDEADELYRFVVAQVVLLTVRDVFEAEPAIDSVTFLGMVDGLDPATGQPQLLSVLNLSVDRETFGQLDLGEEWPEDCLRRLDAPINPDPAAAREQVAEPV